MNSPRPTVSFVCVQNAGRSQMATAFARRENQRRGMSVRILTGGTNPAERVHPEVVEAMNEAGIDLSEEKPREIREGEADSSDYLITMGCDSEDVCPSGWFGETRDWPLDDPHGKPVDEVRSIRDEIERRVQSLFDELQSESP